jgi:zinc protease
MNTSLDRTNYYETVGSQDLPMAVMLEADRMRNLRLREEDRRPEMTVVRNEYERGENSPSEALEKEIWATAFLAHPYHHSTIGWRSDFEKVPIEKLRAFYDTWYRPERMAIITVGDMSPQTLETAIRNTFGPLQARATAVAPPDSGVPLYRETRMAVTSDPEVTSSSSVARSA